MTVTSAAVPDSLAVALSPQWLTAALRPRFAGVEIGSVTAGPVIDRISTNARFVIEATGARPAGLPTALCVKGYFNDIGRTAPQIGAPEAYFYRAIADRVGVRTLRAVYADIDPTTRHGVIITEDVVTQGATFLDGNSPYTPEDTAHSLTELARLHAKTWCDSACGTAPWLAPRLGGALRAWGAAKTTDTIATNLRGPNGIQVPDGIRDAPALLAAYRRLMTRSVAETAARSWCVIHGDAHVGNLFTDAEGLPSLVDWQLVQRGQWYLDVGYHIASTLTVAHRRAAERDLLAHYLDALASYGVDPPRWADAWPALADGMLHGLFLWGITTKQPAAVIATLLHRLSTAVTDHDAMAS